MSGLPANVMTELDNALPKRRFDPLYRLGTIFNSLISGAGIVGASLTSAALSPALGAAIPGTPTLVVGAEATNAIAVSVQVKDITGANIAAKHVVKWWLSAAAGGTPTGSAPNGGTAVTTGTALKEHTAEVFGESFTDATGLLVLTVTDSGTPTFYLNVDIGNGAITSSAAITFA